MRSSSSENPTSTASTPSISWNEPTTGIDPPDPISTAGFGKVCVNASLAAESQGESVGTEMAGFTPKLEMSQRQPFGHRFVFGKWRIVSLT